MQKFGGNAIELYPESIGFGKRESDKDILMTLSQYIDCLVIRNDNHKKIKYLSDLNIIPIVNALSNQSHPCHHARLCGSSRSLLRRESPSSLL